MAYTMQQVVDSARIPLNDDAKVRYQDATLLMYVNLALLRVRERRPDLFLGRWLALPGPLALTDTFPLRDELVLSVSDFVTARAETRDDEFSENSRAASFMALFEKALVG